jgi:hypothetical protein
MQPNDLDPVGEIVSDPASAAGEPARFNAGSRWPAPTRIAVKISLDVDKLLGEWAGLTGLQKGEVAFLLLDELIHQDKFLAGLDRIVAAVAENQRQRCQENATKISFPPAGE